MPPRLLLLLPLLPVEGEGGDALLPLLAFGSGSMQYRVVFSAWKEIVPTASWWKGEGNAQHCQKAAAGRMRSAR